MDSPSSNPNPKPVVSMRNSEVTRSPSVERSHSSEEIISVEYPVVAQPSDQDDEDHEYECKYCDKKFSNKQALGGHQNAHKVERTLEKTLREARKNGLGYNFLASYHDLMSRSYISQHHGLPISYNSMPVDPYGPSGNPQGGTGMNGPVHQQEIDESGLDLTLRL